MPLSLILSALTAQRVALREYQLTATPGIDPTTFLELDASLDESYDGTASVTKFPVESGADISDNVQVNPRSVRINGIVSDTPLPSQSLSGFVQGLGAGGVGELLGSVARSVSAYTELERLRRDRVPLELITGLDSFKPVFISSLSVQRTPTTGKALRFTMTLQEVATVTSVVLTSEFGLQPTPNASAASAVGAGGIP